MKRITVTILLICMLLTSNTLFPYAVDSNSGYSYDDGIISFDLEDFNMVPFRETDAPEYKEDPDYALFYDIFDQSSGVKLVVLPQNTKYFWYLGVRDGKNLSSLSNFSEEEIRTFNLSDYSESEISELFSDYAIDGFNKEWDTVNTFNGIPYYVIAGIAAQNGSAPYAMQYLTVIKGYYYVFTLYLLGDDISSEDLSDFHDLLNSIEYKQSNNASDNLDESDNAILESAETTDRRNALMTSLMTVVPIALIIIIVSVFVKSKKKKKVQIGRSEEIEAPKNISDDDNIIAEKENTTAPVEIQRTEEVDPSEELKKYKQMLDDGLITQEDYNLLKAKILKL